MLAGCGGGASPRPDNDGPFTFDGDLRRSDFYDRNDDRYYDIYVLEVTRSGQAQVAMSSFDVDSQLYIYRRDSNGDYGSPVAQDDDSGDGPDAIVNFEVRRGEVYRVVATSARTQEFGNYRAFFSRELGRPSVVPTNQNLVQSATLPRIQSKGAVEKRTQP